MDAVTWTSSPSSPTGIQGQSVTITWIAELPSGAEYQNVKVQQVISPSSENEVILVDRAGGRTVYAAYSSRDADVNLTASQNGTLVTSVFTLRNLNQTADGHEYHLRVIYKTGQFNFDSQDSPNLQLTVLGKFFIVVFVFIVLVCSFSILYLFYGSSQFMNW